MPQIVIRHSENEREIRYEHKEEEVPLDTLYRVVHLMPIEIDRIKKGTPEEVQKILKLHI